MAKRTSKKSPATTAASTIPSVEQLAHAFSYIELEFRTRLAAEGIISGEMWADGLAFGQGYQIDSLDLFRGREAQPQLNAAQWAEITARAATLRAEAF